VVRIVSEKILAVFRAIKEQAKVDKISEAAAHIGLLDAYDVEYCLYNGGNHCVVTTKSGVWDFYPTTGRFGKRPHTERLRKGAAEFFVAAGILSEGGGVLWSRVS
jgi:hypothetical protein